MPNSPQVSDQTRKALHDLKRRVGKERAFYARAFNEKLKRTGQADDRLFGEVNVCDTIMRFIDEAVAKLDG